MNILTILISFLSLFTAQAFAHTDHALGDGSLHTFYHITFWVVFALVVYKGYTWFKKKNAQKN
jgi:membrane protein DedA with SNARE-associated domain